MTIARPWKRGGVYLITGGAGGLGRLFAQEIVTRVPDVNLILTGRSALAETQELQLQPLRAQGARVQYVRMDVSERESVNRAIRDIQQRHGELTGVIHSAGVIRDSFLLKKTEQELRSVFAGKVAGLVNLDEATAPLRLEFFVAFSSAAGVFGNVGQADYAMANAFMDAYLQSRALQVQAGKRHGHSLSINWPLWEEGGMSIDAETRKAYGLEALSNEQGMQAFYAAFNAGGSQVVVIAREPVVHAPASPTSEQESVEIHATLTAPAELSAEELEHRIVHAFKKLLAGVVGVEAQRIQADVEFDRYGMDSIKALQITQALEQHFGSLSKTLLFECRSIEELSRHLIQSHPEQVKRYLGLDTQASQGTKVTPVAKAAASGKSRRSKSARPIANVRTSSVHGNETDRIAIVGVSGRYPQARDLNEYWENLKAGRDCIEEIPAQRWDYARYFDAEKGKIGKSYSKWGGFVPGVDEFDPLFFSISPLEAQFMDPQERLFLQCAYRTLEDAGYTRESLRGEDERSNVGVFVGVMYEEYQLYGAQAQAQGAAVALNGNPSSIANRVSYFCNFHGPSMAVDTMCSSSLTAIHLACESLKRGECAVALAGGVNVSIHPNKYLGLSQGQFASSKGRCESFGEGGDGYVPGEGVGAVLLKPLKEALQAGDHVYGVIRGTAVNHGGKTHGYTVPNPQAQAHVIEQALKVAGVSAREISYIEAHGTGTSLGDPIEIAGLSKAFQLWTQDRQFCRIGSAKSNIGHCESAAGIAGVTKVLLQMQHRTLVPSLHSRLLNPHIDFERTPFVMQRELGEWQRPVLDKDGRKQECARIAGISAFGAGGANAHVVIEEYIAAAEQTAFAITPVRPAIVVLSAKDEERLKERVQQLLGALDSGVFAEGALADIAYTLQVGREAMEERLALLAASIHELREKLHAYLDSSNGAEIYRGTVKHGRETLSTLNADEDTASLVDAWVAKGKYGKLVDLWVKGLSFDWRSLYGETRPRRVPLPGYPFARESYWLPELATAQPAGTGTTQWEEWDVADEPEHPEPEQPEPERADVAADVIEARTLEERTLQQLIQLFSSVTTVSVAKLDAREPLESYGIDSVMIMQLNRRLSQVFGQLSRTLFFEYPTLHELNRYLVSEHRDHCVRWSGIDTKRVSAVQPRSRKTRRRLVSRSGPGGATREPIAIIGLSGRYPHARTLAQYWENLKTGRDCVGEIPADRWNVDEFYCEGIDAALAQGRSYCKWGGFIEGFSEFDPLFFNISPREADGMDPQERLFMQSCWEVLEDAGYTREAIARRHQGRVGVFAGITKTGFELHGPELWLRGQAGFPRTSFGSVANRVSYFLNLNGPSMPIDTMCSASLTAIHEACEHIYRGECELAIAGGVNLYLHPSSYVGMCAAKMLSATGRCKSFGAGGDGMVPAEGVGSVLLKRLSAAVADGDHIYAAILGTSINHGGKTSGYTVPNPQAQREVIRSALDKAGVDARTVSYIEAHGTGTKLGDPIEIAGLTQAFAKDTNDKAFCAIGSVKASMGHAESAAGIAGLTKILLQMKHGQLAPSLHTQELNDNIDFENSPFVVQRELGEWHRPVLAVDGEGKEYPRIAGISSFGAGGANAHVVVREYVPTRQEPARQVAPLPTALIVLSAKDEERLRERAVQLLEAIESGHYRDDELHGIAYTLQVGREAMEHRLAFTANSLPDLRQKLASYLSGEQVQECWQGDVKRHREVLAAFTADEALNDVIRGWARHGKHHKLLDLWSKGLAVDWELLHDDVRPTRVSLPVYPFARNQYWLAADANARPAVANTGDDVDDRFEDDCLQALLDDFVTDELSLDDAVSAARELMSA